MDVLRIDRARLRHDLETLATFGRNAGGGIDRASFSATDTAARTWLIDRCRESGLTYREDGIGNLFFRHEPEGPAGASNPAGTGAEPSAPVWTGSHIDAVPNGGRFDGAAGVIAAVEVVRSLREQQVPLARPVEAVVWSDEEGCYHGLLGSTAVADGLTGDDLDRSVGRDGRNLRQALADSGRDPKAATRVRQERQVPSSYLELHIEQGAYLESSGDDIGVVTAIVGLAHGQASFHGRADHAGTTAMDRRQDALRAAAAFLVRLPELPEETGQPDAVLTCGDVRVAPGADNIVPSEVVCRLDIRDADPDGLAKIKDAVIAAAHQAAAETGTTVAFGWDHLADPVAMDAGLRRLIADVTDRLGYRQQALASRAGHDAQKIAAIAPTAMVFVPSADGRSHCPEEYTDIDELACGADVLLNVVRAEATTTSRGRDGSA